ncbi:hypothetical protein COU74_03645 [Candidatus Peregrinibacteria bacterium CG10_big_fil_rev_8_21_14_0_10_36_19]|nr:MAG: hypothetical protein COU74_03645 [Candidatus Peregrinibacteria bacterium CG10_big_fil_rev_8_21_14_0_10_36_19]
MKLKKKISFLLLLALVFTIALTGCRRKTPPEAQKNYAGIELTYYKFLEDTDVMQPFINDYIAKHPGLKINYRKFSDFDEYQRVLLNEMAEGEGPDLFSVPNTWFASNYKKISPLPLEVGNPEAFSATFVDVAAKDLVRPDGEGVKRIYGLPMTVDNLALYYNKSHFEDSLPQTGKPSNTWEGIKEDVKELSKFNDEYGVFERSGIALGRGDSISRSLDAIFAMMLQSGTQFYDSQLKMATFANRKADFPAFEALKLYTSFSDERVDNFSFNDEVVEGIDGKEVEAFARGDVSMILGYSYTNDQILNYINLLNSRGVAAIKKSDMKVALLPQLYDPQISSNKRVTYANYFAETVSRNSDNPDIAWDFLLELTSKENLTKYFNKTHKPTSRRDMINDQVLDPEFGVFAAQVGFAESFPVFDYDLYKKLFLRLADNFSENGSTLNELVKAQEEVNKLIPKGGFIPFLTPKNDQAG